ncbi:MAG: YhgE/Pip family protein [Bifidobacteriaceae bacterium]|jgi:putative membrane protein|nr:YhgE/Pip family protein [Bifidobacteriaceae bacterium]
MATTFTVAFRGLKKVLSSWFMRVAVVALVLIPSIYSGLYLWANYDPYAKMQNVPVAIACEDKAVKIDSSTFDLGKDVEKKLIEKNVFDMQKTSTGDLRDGVYDEKYLFGVIIPKDFSKEVSTLYSSVIGKNGEEEKPIQSKIILVTNDANSYIIHTAANQVASTLQASISSEVMRQFSDKLLQGLSEVHGNLKKASDSSAQMTAALDELKANSERINNGLQQLLSATRPLPNIIDQLAAGGAKIATGNSEIAKYANEMGNIAHNLNIDWNEKIKPKLISDIESLAVPDNIKQFLLDKVSEIDNLVINVNGKIVIDVGLINQLAEGSKQLSAALDKISIQIPKLVDAVSELTDGYSQFDNGLTKLTNASHEFSEQLKLGYEKIPTFSNEQRENINNIVANPVRIDNEAQAESANYGVGLAPFFFSLSAWVGAYALFVLIRPFKNDELRFSKSDIRAGLGAYIIPLLFGVLQMLCLFFTVTFILNLPIVNHALLLAFFLLMSAAFVAIMFCLVALLDMAGLYVGLILLMLQITSSGGTFPWQTTPDFFHYMHAVLPMSYTVDAIRHIINGGNSSIIANDSFILSLYLLVSLILIVGIAAVKRKPLRTLARFFPKSVTKRK